MLELSIVPNNGHRREEMDKTLHLNEWFNISQVMYSKYFQQADLSFDLMKIYDYQDEINSSKTCYTIGACENLEGKKTFDMRQNASWNFSIWIKYAAFLASHEQTNRMMKAQAI